MAFGGTALLVSPASRLLGSPDRITTKVLEQLVLWLLFAGVLAIVLLWERHPLVSLWIQPLRWTSLAWGLLLAAAIFYVSNPLTIGVARALGLGGFEVGMQKSAALPVWFRIFMCLTAGVVEETLFRGYAVTRLSMLTGSLWLGALLAVAAFALLHLPGWGPGPVLAWFLGGLWITAFFVWRQDLAAMIVAHAVVDLMGFVIVPAYSRRWESG